MIGRWSGRTLLALMLLAALGRAAGAQGQCQEKADGDCAVGGKNSTFAAFITVTTAVRMSLSSAAVALNAPGGAEFEAGFGQTTGPSLTMRANQSWTVTIRAAQATWTASAPPARANKPASDLRWGTSGAGPFTGLTTTAVSLATGPTATAGTVIPLYFRVMYAWTLDTPGTYSLPLQLTITAP